MRSNLILQSNVYVNRTGIVRDKDFVRQVRGTTALKKLEQQLGTYFSNRLTDTQREEISQGSNKCTHDPDHSFGYLRINGKLRWVNRCEQTDCPLFPECSRHENFVPIDRDKPIEIPEKQVKETPQIIDYSVLQHYTTKVVPATPPKEPPITEPEVEDETVVPPAAAKKKEVPDADFYYKKISEPTILIESAPSARILVNAGPGTGKTYTVIQRLAHLAQTGDVDLQNVLVLCFSRSAVAVIKNRLEEKIEKGNLPLETRLLFNNIRTMDSFATLMIREIEDSLEQMSYNQRIEAFIKIAEEHSESFQEIEYLIIDEIQDIVGVRAEMIMTILKHLSCGFMLLGDKCQAIYDYLPSDDSNDITSAQFYNRLESDFSTNLQGYELTVNRRQQEHLAELSQELRQSILAASEASIKETLSLCISCLDEVTYTDLPAFLKRYPTHKFAILCNTNARVAIMSEKLFAEGIPHTVALGSHHVLLPPWLGEILSNYTERLIGYSQFADRAVKSAIENPEIKWQLLKTLEGKHVEDVLDISKLRDRLSRRHNLPRELDLALEQKNVVVSTIFRAKGREYDGVIWVQENKPTFEPEVAYVAMTRPRRKLRKLPMHYFFWVENLSSTRSIEKRWSRRSKGKPYCRALLMGF